MVATYFTQPGQSLPFWWYFWRKTGLPS